MQAIKTPYGSMALNNGRAVTTYTDADKTYIQVDRIDGSCDRVQYDDTAPSTTPEIIGALMFGRSIEVLSDGSVRDLP